MDDQRGGDVREDVQGEDARGRGAERDRGLHVGGPAHGEDRAAHDAHEGGRVDDADRQHDVDERGAEHRGDRDRQQDRGEGEEDVHQQRERAVEPAAAVAGDQPEQHAERARDADRDHADLEGDARAVEQAAEDVAAELVGAEPVERGWRLQARAQIDLERIERRPERGRHGGCNQNADQESADRGIGAHLHSAATRGSNRG